jgi:hypothetical protein
MATTLDARLAYYGKTLVEAFALSSDARAGELVISSSALAEQQRIQALLEELGAGAAIQPAPRLGVAAWCVHVLPAAPVAVDTTAPTLESARRVRPSAFRARPPAKRRAPVGSVS